jgi:hypothetical protein
MENKYIFIVGTGRIGTKFMADFLSKNFLAVYGIHEPSRKIKIASNKRICGALGTQRMEKILKRYKEKTINRILKKTKSSVYVESNSWIIGSVDLLEKVFPSLYIIHIVRDPATYIPSHLNRINATFIGGSLRKIIPFWLLRGDKAGDYTKGQWKELSHEERMAWYWFKANKLIEDSTGNFSNYLQLKYEDVFNKDYSGLKEIAKFTDLTPKDIENTYSFVEQIHKTKVHRFSSFSNWSTPLKKNISIICAPFLEKYGYMKLEDR